MEFDRVWDNNALNGDSKMDKLYDYEQWVINKYYNQWVLSILNSSMLF